MAFFLILLLFLKKMVNFKGKSGEIHFFLSMSNT